MNVLLVSIGSELLSDILDTNASLAARRLLESHIPLIGKVTLGDDLYTIQETLRIAFSRVDVVITIGGLGNDKNDFTREAVAIATDRSYSPDNGLSIPDTLPLGGPEVLRQGFLLEQGNHTLICLPGKPRDMAYLLETEVLPWLHRRIKEGIAYRWALLRTAGVMESTLEQQLADLNQGDRQRVSFSSFAGQTDIGLWVEGESQEWVNNSLESLVDEVLNRLGDQVYGQAGDRLEDVLLHHLQESQIKVAAAECYTNSSLTQSLGQGNGPETMVKVNAFATSNELAQYLELAPLTGDGDLTRWCRLAAEKLKEQAAADIGLVVYNNITPGGVQLLVTLASSHGVSVMQRSFGGHPDNIDQWASTLGLVHLRRWLLAHHPLNNSPAVPFTAIHP